MIMPVRQRCPKCGHYFMGSDAIGEVCSDCSGASIMRVTQQVPLSSTTSKIKGAIFRIKDKDGEVVPEAQIEIKDATGLYVTVHTNEEGAVDIPFLLVNYIQTKQEWGYALGIELPQGMPIELLPTYLPIDIVQQELQILLQKHHDEIIRVFDLRRKS